MGAEDSLCCRRRRSSPDNSFKQAVEVVDALMFVTLCSILSFVNSPELAQPQGYIQLSEGLITDDGEVREESTRDFLVTWLTAFEGLIGKVTSDEIT